MKGITLSRHTRLYRITALFLLCVMMLRSSSWCQAALPPLSDDELESYSTIHVIATVVNAKSYIKRNSFHSKDKIHELEVELDQVFKGDNLKPSDHHDVTCWEVYRRPFGWAGPGGHDSIPGLCHVAEFWLTDDWEPLEPNGVKTIRVNETCSEENSQNEDDECGCNSRFFIIRLLCRIFMSLLLNFPIQLSNASIVSL